MILAASCEDAKELDEELKQITKGKKKNEAVRSQDFEKMSHYIMFLRDTMLRSIFIQILRAIMFLTNTMLNNFTHKS